MAYLLSKSLLKYIFFQFSITLIFSLALFTNLKSEIVSPSLHEELEDGYYVITGVFSSEENAKAFSAGLKARGYTASYAFSSLKKLHYCYVLKTDSLALAENKYYELKKLPEFANIWILKMKNHTESKVQETSMEPAAPEVAKSDTIIKTIPANTNQKDISHTHHSYKILVNLHDQNKREVLSVVKVITSSNEKVLASLKPHQEHTLHIPKKESQAVQLVCEAFGYHKTVIALPLNDFAALSAMKNIKIEGEKIHVDFELEKCQKGDLMTMFNVFFRSESNIMRLKSQEELQTLLTVLQDNPTLKIMIHGHTNGNSNGPITKIPDNCDNFFDPSATEQISGSSVKLSLLRAEAIKMYLIKNGITADRIDVKGWGGKKMIFKEDSPHSENNVRVEVEVLTD